MPGDIRLQNRLVKVAIGIRPKAMLNQEACEGDMLLTIEAMKMESGLCADRHAKAKALHTHAGTK